MAVNGTAANEGIVCLANDGIIDGLIALCESLRANSPDTPLTVIPFDENLALTREVLRRFGHAIYDDASLAEMDAVGARYWPGARWRASTMRKFCAFWGPYDRFLFLDADVVVLRPLDRYFEAVRDQAVQFMYFSTDMTVVYRAPLSDEMVAKHGAVGFNTGVFMGRKGTITPAMVERALAACRPHRRDFVDINEQTFLNYVVDVAGLPKVNAHQALPDVIDGWAGMRLKRRGNGFLVADARVPPSGRPVTLIHWAGYPLGPFMPYRSTFLTYRLADAGTVERIAYRASALAAAGRGVSARTPLRLAYRWRSLSRNWLHARGHYSWPA